MRDHFNKIISSRLKSLRRDAKISREHLEEQCALPIQSVKRIEAENMSKIDVNDLCAIAKYFNVDVEYLLGKQDTPLRTVSDASTVTGLTYDAVSVLSNFGRMHQTEIDTISAMICSPSFLPFVDLMKRYCLLEDNSRSLLKDAHSYLSDKEVMVAAIQNSMSLLMNETKKAAQDNLVKADIRTRAFALVASSMMNVNRDVSETDILEALTECGLDAKQEIQAFHEYFSEYKQTMKGRE